MIEQRNPFRRSSRAGHRPTARANLAATMVALTMLAGCAARQASEAVASGPAVPGFLLGVWHGFIFPVAWVASLFVPDVALYAVPNNGGWYDFGYFVGIVVLGVGSHKSKTVYRTVYVDRRR